MTDALDTEIGKLMRERQGECATKACLQKKAERLLKQMVHTRTLLESIRDGNSVSAEFVPSMDAWPSVTDLESLQRDMEGVNGRLRALSDQLGQMGISVK